METQYQLLSYGIPEELLIADRDGKLKSEYVELWIRRQRERELRQQDGRNGDTMSTRSNGTIDRSTDIVATNSDILLGRGIPIQSHPGNVRLAQIIEDQWADYNNAAKFDKTAIAWNIVKMIQSNGGRFLERDKADIGKWKVTADDTARHKVSYGFRSHAKLKRRDVLDNLTMTGGYKGLVPNKQKRAKLF